MHRLFIALMPSSAVRNAIDAHRRHWRWPPGARLVGLPRIHLTLHFLGDVDSGREAELVSALGEVPMPELTLRLGTPEVWRRNGVAVLRSDPAPALDAVHGALGAAVQRLGLGRVGESWAPHLTLARHAAQALPPPHMAPISWSVREFALVWSQLPPPVARYEVLARYGAARKHAGFPASMG